MLLWRTGRQHPGGRPLSTEGKHSLSSQADPRRQEPRPTLRQQDNLAGVNRFLSQTSVQPSTLREPSPARAPKIQHRDRFRCPVPRRRAIALATHEPRRALSPARSPCRESDRRFRRDSDERYGDGALVGTGDEAEIRPSPLPSGGLWSGRALPTGSARPLGYGVESQDGATDADVAECRADSTVCRIAAVPTQSQVGVGGAAAPRGLPRPAGATIEMSPLR
jgi:hypothetical protein